MFRTVSGQKSDKGPIVVKICKTWVLHWRETFFRITYEILSKLLFLKRALQIFYSRYTYRKYQLAVFVESMGTYEEIVQTNFVSIVWKLDIKQEYV